MVYFCKISNGLTKNNQKLLNSLYFKGFRLFT